jgi:biopolymer transport protein ExbD
MRIRDNSPPPASFQLAPMIDIVFLLLIFFLVTYQITEQEKDLKIAVPTTSEGSQKARVANKIVINLSTEGVITISGEVHSKDQLREKLERIVKASELANEGGADQQPVRIRADGAGSNQQLVEVIDEIKKAGIWNIDIATRSPKS